MMTEEVRKAVATLARDLSGAAEDDPLLARLCGASVEDWLRRLRSGVTLADCQSALVCAAAFSALAAYRTARASGVTSFTAGIVSVHGASAAEEADTLRRQAERLMAPWTEPEDFVFRGVRA